MLLFILNFILYSKALACGLIPLALPLWPNENAD